MDPGSSPESAAPALAAEPDSRGDAFYRGLFERIPVGVYRTTRDGRMVEANPALVRIAGYPGRQAFLAAPVEAHWVDPGERARWQARMERDGEVHDFEYLHRRHDGTAVWVRETARTLRGVAGQVVGYEGMLEDVTGRRAAEDRLRFQVELLEGLRESVSATDLHGRITYWNDASAELFGWSAGEALGRSVLDVCVAPSMREHGAAILGRVARGDRYSGEFLARRRGAGDLPILLSVSPVRDGDGRIVGSVGIASDLSPQKRAEEVQRFLAEAGTVLSSSLDCRTVLASVARMAVPTLADWCYVDLVHDDGSIRRVASAHVDPARDALARGLMEWPRCPHGPTVSARVIRGGKTWWVGEIGERQLEEMSAHADHLRILRQLELLSGIAVPLKARGRTLGVLRFATSRGGRRYGQGDVRLAEELARRVALAVDNARLYDRAQAAVEARERVLRVVSHDLRNPLGAVAAHAEMLAAHPEAPAADRRQWTGVISRAADRMGHMIGDLLDAALLEDGRLSIEPAPCAARPLLLEAAEMLRPAAGERGVRLAVEGSDEGAEAHADRERVLQVLSNLVGNALRFTPAGGTVSLRAARCGGEVRFSVADTGPGVCEDEMDRLFEPFWRGRTARRDGLGLGLAIARWLVEAHGGRIWAENGAGGGAVFHFALPAAAAAASPAAA
jgi:PAS domain S-box-containing protein